VALTLTPTLRQGGTAPSANPRPNPNPNQGSRQPPSAAAPPPEAEVGGETSGNGDGKGGDVRRAVPLMYDRVLCDVPCRWVCSRLRYPSYITSAKG